MSTSSSGKHDDEVNLVAIPDGLDEFIRVRTIMI